jgi:hypothetical protein
MIRLLGDMRSYNYVIVPTHDFDNVIFKIRAIDFDQQCFEGKFKVYYPQFFKENNKMVQLVSEKLQEGSIAQYKAEERSMIAKRILTSENRLNALLHCMRNDNLSTEEKVTLLKNQIFEFTKDINFKKLTSMGEILSEALQFVRRNYEDVNRSI